MIVHTRRDNSVEEKMSFKIDESKAKEAARRFLGQYHNVVDTEAVLENNVWLVTTYLGSTSSQRRIVRIDADSGKILGYT